MKHQLIHDIIININTCKDVFKTKSIRQDHPISVEDYHCLDENLI